MFRAVLIALVFAGTAVFAGEGGSEGIMVHDVKAAASIGSAKAGAGYLVIMNHSGKDDRLIAVEAEFPRVEIHNTVEVDGLAKMVRQDEGIVIPAGESISLAPGGYHVMFMGLPAPFKAGQSFEGILIFEKAGTIPITFDIVDREMLTGQMGSDHSGHGGNDGTN